jgi:hypothetical protein
MPQMLRHLALCLLALLLVAAPLGCYDIKPPPVPTTTRLPTIVGEATGWSDPNVSVAIDTGGDVAIDDPRAQLTTAPVQFRSTSGPGSLVLAGSDENGAFYAVTRAGTADGCFELHGQGYTEADRIHLSSGLVVPFAPNITVENGRFDQYASWLMDYDNVCVDRTGHVTSIRKLPFGA